MGFEPAPRQTFTSLGGYGRDVDLGYRALFGRILAYQQCHDIKRKIFGWIEAILCMHGKFLVRSN